MCAGWGLEEIDAGRIALVSPDGSVLDGAGPRHIEYPILTEIMAARPDVGSVVHTHSPAANEFAALDVPLRPLDHAGSLFCYPDIPSPHAHRRPDQDRRCLEPSWPLSWARRGPA